MSHIPSVGFISLGCAKNLYDTERLSSLLVSLGYRIESSYENCDAVIINSCGFIEPAIEESLDAISQALEAAPVVIVTGCLGSRADFILEHYPQVQAVHGPGRRAAVVRSLERLIGQPPMEARVQLEPSGVLLTPVHYAYLKIAEGCRHHCSFCIIPQLRGQLRSRLPETLYAEASDLKRRGVRELLLIAQDSSDYGLDLKERSSLSKLCRSLADLELWLRVHYVYPSPEADRLVELMAEGLVLPYLDLPLQHVSLPILRSMKRPGNLEQMLQNIERWRSLCPDLTIRSTFITGYPGETESQFEELLDFLKAARLDRVGCFPYSEVSGAAANELPQQVPEEIKEERAERLMQLQAQISYDKLEERMGTTTQVLIDYVSEDHEAIGRSKYESPEVDGIISIAEGGSLKPGDLVKVRLTAHDEHDLQGELADAPEPIQFSTR
ncbi:MAG: 30S ribosomal protein S12 methylthiotransferase RimO [Succinivibrio sp.]|nr:30S ribosomal protein S12 methylthiotransferase RimO [Succinivibrio sp.]